MHNRQSLVRRMVLGIVFTLIFLNLIAPFAHANKRDEWEVPYQELQEKDKESDKEKYLHYMQFVFKNKEKFNQLIETLKAVRNKNEIWIHYDANKAM